MPVPARQQGTIWAQDGGKEELRACRGGDGDAGSAGALAVTVAPKHLKRAGGKAFPGENPISVDT